MKLKKIIAMGAVIAVFASSAFSVSAAEKISAAEINDLKKSGNIELILDVEAYKAAYSDLEKAFGDNVDAYIEHYLTIGVYEGRNKGVLFDPLAYAEAYGDVKNAFGTDISAIVNHYVTHGVKENRTAGTANGYADLAAAEKNGAAVSGNNSANRYAGNAANNIKSTGNRNNGAAASTSNATGNAAGSTSVNNVPTGSTPVNNAQTGSTAVTPGYHHTTSIYADDGKTLIRVEYYDDNNHLFQYSDVTDYDSDTNSYKETVYNAEDNGLDRTDTYDNGSLSSSEKAE
ncbi:MAG: hypothetical protein NC313_12705 [Butyrivibrio sp.]|nr:hypothetical protein [Butyrivibrio sp.]